MCDSNDGIPEKIYPALKQVSALHIRFTCKVGQKNFARLIDSMTPWRNR
nr:hypothetical protein [Klebsiella oxytoca]URQ56201.1 Hypothetical protein [Raoultella ornithinolytica]